MSEVGSQHNQPDATMNTANTMDDGARLSSLLRQARPSPNLPPHFAEGVWRRLEQMEAEPISAPWWSWADRLVAAVLRPRMLAGGFALVMVLGVLVGALTGAAQARDSARAAYLASVAPNALH